MPNYTNNAGKLALLRYHLPLVNGAFVCVLFSPQLISSISGAATSRQQFNGGLIAACQLVSR